MEFLDLDFSTDAGDSKTHTYTSHRKGDWIIFKCPKCEGHERRLNWRTGQMKVVGTSEARHQGVHYPTGVDHTLLNSN